MVERHVGAAALKAFKEMVGKGKARLPAGSATACRVLLAPEAILGEGALREDEGEEAGVEHLRRLEESVHPMAA